MRSLGLLTTFMVLVVLAACQRQPDVKPLFGGLDNTEILSAEASPDYSIQFPNDHSEHPKFAVEWWYFTANLFDSAGNQYPVQWTLFRFLNDQTDTPWSNHQAYMAHAKIATKKNHWFQERFARGGVGNAGVASSPFVAFMDDWVWQSNNAHLLPANLSFSLYGNVSANLALTSKMNPVLHGEDGYSVKLRNGSQASHYYSQPFIDVSGDLLIDGQTIEVKGTGWFDHEWSAQYFNQSTLGWDWFSIHLEDGSKLMLFRMRNSTDGNFWSGTFINSEGVVFPVKENDIKAQVTGYSDVQGKPLPLKWSIDIPTHQLQLTISPFKLDQWNNGLFSYYEGAIAIDGPLEGHGFIELTGY